VLGQNVCRVFFQHEIPFQDISNIKSSVAKFYKSTTEFPCISNPLHKIPLSQINDDYCDCSDGSDEPGTSACSHISPLSPNTLATNPSIDNITLALPGFYCKNKGHIPSYLPFTSVNDGRCDYTLCCDGSDEWQHVGGITCPDKCKEIGKEWRKKDEVRKKALGVAMKRKKELVAEAANLRHLVESRVGEFEVKVKSAEEKLKETESILEEAEKSEKLKVVRAGDGKAGRASVLASMAKTRVEELRDNLVEVRKQRNALDERLKELEATLSALKEEHNPNFNDEGVKRAVRAWEEYAARDKQGIWEAAKDRDLDEILKPDDETNGINWAEWEMADDATSGEAEGILFALSAYAPPSLRLWLDSKLTSFRTLLIESGILADTSTSSTNTESAAITTARSQRDSAHTSLTSTQNDLTNAKSDLDKDYGTSDVFRALKDKCITKASGEYTYELCFLGSTKQKPMKGGGDTTMGHFVGIASEYVDADVDAEGKGLGVGERVVLKYENGQSCWNGPARSTVVVLGCSAEEEIWRISESEKCVYRMEVGTAAVCEDDGGKRKAGRDEL
jgi:protein kinase C substrate 80K-H